jgi:hypothetical protein
LNNIKVFCNSFNFVSIYSYRMYIPVCRYSFLYYQHPYFVYFWILHQNKINVQLFNKTNFKKLSHWYLLWRSSPQLVKYLQIFTWNMPSVRLDTNFYTISLEKFEESVNRRRIDNTIKEQTMIYKTLHRKLKIEHWTTRTFKNCRWTQMRQKSKQFLLHYDLHNKYQCDNLDQYSSYKYFVIYP